MEIYREIGARESTGKPTRLAGAAVDAFIGERENVVLFFTENPTQYPESNDVAVILPELLKAFGGQLDAAVIHRDAERALQPRYGFSQCRGRYIVTLDIDLSYAEEHIEQLGLAAPIKKLIQQIHQAKPTVK